VGCRIGALEGVAVVSHTWGNGLALLTPTPDADPFVNEQRIRGCYLGSSRVDRDVPALVERYVAGELLLDEIISSRIGLDGLTAAVDRLRAGEGVRSVLVFDRDPDSRMFTRRSPEWPARLVGGVS
jgi:S-(hydroxymethyl)glutathione dehydrogenase / alcohol dehydrogenase